MDISEKVAELLKSKKCAGESHKKIAGDIGIAPSVLSKLCAGNSKSPSADTVLAIAKYFNVSTDWLLGNADYPTTNKATQELCKTLGLSDISIEFLQSEKYLDYKSTINILIEQCYNGNRVKEMFPDDVATRNACNSLIGEITKYLEICKLKANEDLIIDLLSDGTFIIENSENFITQKCGDIQNNVKYCENIEFKMSLYDVALDEIVKHINLILEWHEPNKSHCIISPYVDFGTELDFSLNNFYKIAVRNYNSMNSKKEDIWQENNSDKEDT